MPGRSHIVLIEFGYSRTAHRPEPPPEVPPLPPPEVPPPPPQTPPQPPNRPVSARQILVLTSRWN